MLLFFLSVLQAEPKIDTEVALHGIVGEGDVLLRQEIQQSLTQALVLQSSKQSIWIVGEEEQRRRLQWVEDELSCVGDCVLPIAKKINLDFVIAGELSVVQKDDGKHYILVLSLYSVRDDLMKKSLTLDELQPMSILAKMNGVAKTLLDPGTESSSNVEEQSETVLQSHFLSIQTEPKGAIVIVDEKVICRETPCSASIPEGMHKVSIQLEAYEQWSQELDIREDTNLSPTLVPTFGVLDIIGNEKAGIWIDGAPISSIPIYNYRLSEGKHIISVNDPCYFRFDQELEVKKGEKYSITLTPESRTVPVKIDVLDSFSASYESDVLLDGKALGKTPYEGHVPMCAKEIEVQLKRDEETLTRSQSIQLNSSSNKIVVSIPDRWDDPSRSVSFNWNELLSEPIWYGALGYRETTHNAYEEPRFHLSSGYIQPIASGFDGGIYDYSIPADMFLTDDMLIGGLGLSLAINASHAYLRFDIDYGVTGDLYYYAPENNGFPLMVYSPDFVSFSSTFGFMPMFRFFRPFVGVRLQGGGYSMDILEVGTDSEFLSSYALSPYYLVSTDYDEDGYPIRPKLEMGELGIGPSAGGLLYFLGRDFMLGLEVQYSYLFTTSSRIYQVDSSLVFGNRF